MLLIPGDKVRSGAGVRPVFVSQGGTVPGGAAQPLRRGLQRQSPNGWLEVAGLLWASVAVIGPGDLVVGVSGFDLLCGDGVLGSTISLRREGSSYSLSLLWTSSYQVTARSQTGRGAGWGQYPPTTPGSSPTDRWLPVKRPGWWAL